MEIVEHSIMDDLVIVGGDFYVAEHLVVRNDIVGAVNLKCVDRDLHISADMEFVVVDVDSLVADVNEGLLMKHYV